LDNNPLVLVIYLPLLTSNTPRVSAEFVAEVVSFCFELSATFADLGTCEPGTVQLWLVAAEVSSC
jgi:hypothetical protein